MIDVSDIQTDIKNSENQIRALQHQTVEYVAFQTNGKIIITDKPALDSANEEISRLQGMVSSNGEVLARLGETLGEGVTVESIRTKKRRFEDQISQTQNSLRLDVADLIRNHFDANPESPFDHPEGRKLKEKADEALGIINPLLSQTADLLTRAEAIISEFKPSGLEAMPDRQHFTGITRAKTGGMA